MTKATMPQPVAFLVEWKSQDQTWVQAQADEVTARDQAVRQRGRVSDLITTDQAEAYAAAKVREALETAIRECRSQFHDWALEVNESNEGESSMEEVEEIVRLSFIERRIRALIPSTPA